MPTFINTLLIIFFFAYGTTIIFDLFREGRNRHIGMEFLALIIMGLLLNLTTGFPSPDKRISFGGASTNVALFVIFIGIILGMTGRYFFYLRRAFSLKSFLKPFCVSPIILLPLLGLLQENKTYETLELLSLGLLAFQNGFFWHVIFDRAKGNKQSLSR